MSRVAQVPSTRRERSDASIVSVARRLPAATAATILRHCRRIFPFSGLKGQPYPAAQCFWDAAKAAFCSAVASFWYFARHSSYGIP